MIEFIKLKDKVILVHHYTDNSTDDWLRDNLKSKGHTTVKKILHFRQDDLIHIDDYIIELDKNDEFREDYFDFEELEPISFVFAEKINKYFRVRKELLSINYDIYFFEEIEFELEYFLAEIKISIFKQISELVKEDIFIGGNQPNAIHFEVFESLIQNFPNTYEKRLYAETRITSIIKEYFENIPESDIKFEKYLNKKVTEKGENLLKTFQELELLKYQKIYDKLKLMLDNESTYNENQWQDEILQIILLLYPKYFLVFKEAPIRSAYDSFDNIRKKYIDFLLIDSNGNIDIIEIKRPSGASLMTKGLYRSNHIPLRELSGTIMQIEKYIYYLNRWGRNGEKFLTQKYEKDLPENMNIKITNPKGFIIMGRENNLSAEQKKDFEVVKRKYKNVVDIISYDDLLERLKFTISNIKKI